MTKLLKALCLSAALTLTSALCAMAETPSGKDMEKCAGDCSKCATRCEKALKYFNSKGGKYTQAENIKLIKDCIAACKFSAELKSRNSEFAGQAGLVCSEICSKCATMCDDLKDPTLKDCVDMCKQCGSSCEHHGKLKASADRDCCGECGPQAKLEPAAAEAGTKQ